MTTKKPNRSLNPGPEAREWAETHRPSASDAEKYRLAQAREIIKSVKAGLDNSKMTTRKSSTKKATTGQNSK